MLGESSREEKLAAARKKLKQYQKRKEAEKAKGSSSRQSTPDSQGEIIAPNGKETIQVELAKAAIVSDEVYTEKSLIKENTEVTLDCGSNSKSQINTITLGSQAVGNAYEGRVPFETNSFNGVTDISSTLNQMKVSETVGAYDSNNEQGNIQSYFKTETNLTGNLNIFEDISSTHPGGNMDAYFSHKEINDADVQHELPSIIPQPIDYGMPNVEEKDEIARVQMKENNQLEVHSQTISILVAEKSELQTLLQQTARDLEQKKEEALDLLHTLESSQNKVDFLQESNTYLTKELNSVTESVDKSTTDHDLLNRQLEKYSSTCEDLKAMNEELNARLAQEFDDKSQLSQELSNTKSKLELANIHIQQLRDSSNEAFAKEITSLKQAKEASEKQIVTLQTTLDQASVNKASIEQEYKSYGKHLVAQLEVAYQKIKQNETAMEELARTKAILEANFESLKSEQPSNDRMPSTEQLDKLNKICQDLTLENETLKRKYSALELDNKALSKMCVEQRQSLEKMEVAVERRDSNEVDTTQLLQAMQSDKVAAARALSQNRQLKEQLEELQNGFIMMSNKKLELTEKLEIELHFKKGLQKQMEELNEQISLYSQMTAHKMEKLQPVTTTDEDVTEVTKSEDTLDSSLPEGSSPRNVILASRVDAYTQVVNDEVIVEETGRTVAEALRACADDEEVGNQPSAHTSGDLVSTMDSDKFIKKDIYLSLENRFTKCMTELAAAQDEKEYLDHLVQRLQLETEAVGDYITIYQFQRGVMKKEVEELKCELSQLKTEREKMHTKLASLQNLVGRLTAENGVPSVTKLDVDAEMPDDNVDEENPSSKIKEISDSPNVHTEQPANKQQTVRKIMNLISEMESTSQVDVSVLTNFHPCPLCSGKLINV